MVTAPLKLNDGAENPTTFNYGPCYRAAGTNDPLVFFYGGNKTVQGTATTTPVGWTAAQTRVPGMAGTWEVGFCAQNSSNQLVHVEGAGSVSGWIEVVNPAP